jgi:hypothetical protein
MEHKMKNRDESRKEVIESIRNIFKVLMKMDQTSDDDIIDLSLYLTTVFFVMMSNDKYIAQEFDKIIKEHNQELELKNMMKKKAIMKMYNTFFSKN